MSNNISRKIDQSRATAAGDVVAGNKSTAVAINTTYGDASFLALEKLVQQLQEEKQNDAVTETTIANLSYFKRRRTSADGINGLDAKLKHSQREAQIEDAIEQKLLFVTLLEEWSYYASAQEIFAHLLAKIDRGFKSTAYPHVSELPPHVIDQMVDTKVLEPIVNECGKVTQFHVNMNVALGMLYWLADHCFIRWHK